MKKLAVLALVATLGLGILVACGNLNAVNKTEAATDGLLAKDAAKTLVLADAGVNTADISGYSIIYELDNGVAVYDIEFFVGGMEYDYEINAKSGLVISKDVHDAGYDPDKVIAGMTGNNAHKGQAASQTETAEPTGTHEAQAPTQPTQPQPTQTPAQPTQTQPTQPTQPARTPAQTQPAGSAAFDLEAAKTKALSLVPGATAANITKAHSEWDDGRTEYEIEIIYNQVEYDFEILGDGTVVKQESEPIYSNRPAQTQPTQTPAQTQPAGNSAFDLEAAKTKALSLVPGATAANITKVKSEWDDGRLEYEIEIVYNQMEYDFEILGDGTVVKMESESVYD